MTTWRELITEEMESYGETLDDIIGQAPLSTEWMDQPFDARNWRTEGLPFTVWTATRIYFPTSYDGQESVASVSRHPDGQPTGHIGRQD